MSTAVRHEYALEPFRTKVGGKMEHLSHPATMIVACTPQYSSYDERYLYQKNRPTGENHGMIIIKK